MTPDGGDERVAIDRLHQRVDRATIDGLELVGIARDQHDRWRAVDGSTREPAQDLVGTHAGKLDALLERLDRTLGPGSRDRHARSLGTLRDLVNASGR